jgi:hypothetical protein
MADSTATNVDPVASGAIIPQTEVSSQVVEAGVAGKGRGGRKGKSKAVKVAEVVDQNDEDEESDEEMGNVEEVQMGVDSLDIAAHRAIFSLNRINLHKPPLTLKFGNWNSRPLRPNRAKELLDTMKSQEIRPFRLQNMIPIIIPQSDVDPAWTSRQSLQPRC